MEYRFDAIDLKILRSLQRNCRQTIAEIADQVGLSPTPCQRRIRLLEKAGAIDRYVAILDPTVLGYGMTFFTRVWLTGQDGATVDRFTTELSRLPNIVECHLMAGDCDFLLRILARDIEDYRRFQIEHLNVLPGVQSVKTEVPMQRIKLSSEIPI